MTTLIRLLPCVLAVTLSVVGALHATNPTQPSTTGKVLLLTNERAIEGDIERVGEQYRVRRTVGETWVPGDKVLRLCASLEDAYTFLRSRANLGDADEHLRLARWCQLNGLRAQALAEVTAAVKLRPNDAASRRLLANLHYATAPAAPPASASPREDVEPVQEAKPIDLDMDSQNAFANKVQPILMNVCASCHAAGQPGAFKLVRVYGSAVNNRKSTLQNLTAVVAQVDLQRPEASPFLIKAATVHGDMTQPPLKGRQLPAYRTLEEWARLAAANNPQLREQGRGAVAAARVPEPKVAPDTLPAKSGFAVGEESTGRPVAPANAAGTATPETPPAAPAVQQEVALDPFDPLPFNRQMHPNRKVRERK